MIDKLTAQQEQQLLEHRAEYLRRGLSVEPIDIPLSSKAIFKMYELIGQKKPYFWVCRSPLMCQLIINILKTLKIEKGSNLLSNLRSNLRSNLLSNLESNLRSNLRSNLLSNLRSNLLSNLESNLWSNLESNLWSNLWSKFKFINFYFWGQQENYWIAFYQYPRFYLNIDYGKFSEILDLWDDIGKSCCWWNPFENIVFVSDRPCEVHKNDRGQLHKNGSPALLFRDGYCLWMLNGVEVPRYLAETTEGNLNIDFFKKEKNSDVRAEFIRKYGIERMQSLGKKICDSKNHSNEWFRKSEYELWDMGNIFNKERAPFLKMKNLTTEIYHFEGVPDDCDSIEKALNFRAKNRTTKLEGVS